MILRQSKSCKGCGAFATEHSPTCLNNEFTPSRALAVAVKEDPLVIERTVNQLRYGIQPTEENYDESPSPAEEMSAAGTYFPKVEGKTWNPKSAPVLGAGKYQASSELMETLSSYSDSIDSSTDSYEEIQKMGSDDPSDSSDYDNYSNSDSYSSSYSTSSTETADSGQNNGREESGIYSAPIASDPDSAMPSLPDEEPYLPAAPSEQSTGSVIPSSSIGKIPGPKFGATAKGGIGASAIGAMAAAAGMRQLTEAAKTVKDNNEPQPEVDDLNRYADAYNPSNSSAAFIPEPSNKLDRTEQPPEQPKDGPAFQPEEKSSSQESIADKEKQTAHPGFFDLSGNENKEQKDSEENSTKKSGSIFDATPPAVPEPTPAIEPQTAPVEEVKPVKKRAVMNQNFFSATMNDSPVSIKTSQDDDDSHTRIISQDSRVTDEEHTVLIKENNSARKNRSEEDSKDTDEPQSRKNTGKGKKKKDKDSARKSSAPKTKRRSFSSKREDEEDQDEDYDDAETDETDDNEIVDDNTEDENGKGSKKSSAEKKTKNKTAKGDKNSKDKNELLSELVDLTKKETPKAGKQKYHDRFSKNSAKEPDKTVTVLGRTFSQKFLITIGLLVMMAGFPSLVLVSTVYTIFHDLFPGKSQGTSSSAGTTTQGGPSPITIGQTGLSGKWDLAFQNQNTIEKCSMNLDQKGNTIQGWGVDRRGPFQIGGTVNGTTLNFTKIYVQQGQAVGKPIQYQGVLSTRTIQTGPVLQLDGKWEVTKREGYSWRAQVVTYSGPFQARLTAPAQTAATTGAGSSAPGTPGNTERDPKKAHGFFFNVAIGIVGIGVAIAMLSLKFFGPSGLLNIWAKKEYIPSQFKSQHFKMVKEMGKPLRIGDIPLGMREEWGFHQFWLPRNLCLPSEIRDKNPHILIIGAGATGKSRLLASMVAQDIKNNDRAVVVIDSDGSLADLLLDWIASQPDASTISKRVLVVDPTNNINETTYNPLEFPPDGDLQNTASALVFGFKAAYTEPPGSQSQWNQQTANILRNCAVLLMANNKTLTDLPVLLSDNDFRDVLLEKVEAEKSQRSEYITLVDAWTNYKRLARTDQWITWIEPILNRVQPMLSDPRLRSILTKPKSDLDLREVICQKQVLIVKIPQGHLDRNGNLLGSLMVAGLKQAALSLSSRKSSKKRHPCSLYLDELDSFIEKETFDSITTETRKLQIGFCGTSKTLQTLPEDFRNQLIINVGMIAIFALAKKDADMLGPQMFRVDGRKVKHQTIQNVFNKVNSSPQFELIMDEEKLNIDRVVGQEKQTYFCYRVGTVAGVFRMKSPTFDDAPTNSVNQDILEKLKANRQAELLSSETDSSDETDDEDDADEADSEFDQDDDDDDDAAAEDELEKPKSIKGTRSSKSHSTKSRRKTVDNDDDENLEEDDDDDDDDEDDDEDEDEDPSPRNKNSKARIKKKR